MKFFSKLLKNPYTQGGFFYTASAFLVSLMNYFFNSIAGRLLGPSGYGNISSFFSYITVLQVPLSVMSYVVIQKVSSREKNTLSYVSSLEKYIFTKVKKFAPFIFFTLVVIPFTPRITNLHPLMAYFIIPILWVLAFSIFYTASLQGLKLFLFVAIVNIFAGVIKLSSVIPIALGWGGEEWVAYFLFGSTLLLLFVYRYLVFRKVDKEEIRDVKPIEKRLLHVLSHPQVIMTVFSIFALNFLSNADVIFVKKFFLPEEAGYYGVWSLFAKMVLYAFGPVFPVVFVYFSGNKNKRLKKFLFPISLSLIVLSVFMYFVYLTFGKLGLHLLFGYRFDYIYPYFGLSAIFGVLYTSISFFSNYFLATKSNGSYILAFLLPLYIGGLFVFGVSLTYIMYVNIAFSFIALLSFFIYIFVKE